MKRDTPKQAAHTPGPWRVDSGSDHFPFSIRPGDTGGLVASVHESILWRDDIAQTAANARLIAAAPDLLAALQDVLKSAVILSREYLEAFKDKPLDATIQGWEKARWLQAADAADKAISAIKKARGE